MSVWLANPGLLLAGAAAVSLPIVIHLLNRRRYHVVDWAAMDFLLAAHQRNRRRIRLENLLLLGLRCLAVLLIVLALARPYFSGGLAAGVFAAARYEHMVILDDSLSMQANLGTETAFDRARRSLLKLCEALAERRSDDSLTLYLASRADQPTFKSMPVNEASIVQITSAIEQLQATDHRTQIGPLFDRLLPDLVQSVPDANRILYIFNDLRSADWTAETESRISQMAEKVQACWLFDCADDEVSNLTIAAIHADGLPLAGLPLGFEVVVKNQGTREAEHIQVKLTAGDSLPLSATIDRLAPQETAAVRLSVLVPDEAAPGDDTSALRVQAELSSQGAAAPDRLLKDSTGYFAAQVVPKLQILLVEGEQRGANAEPQSFYLAKALAPEGPFASGSAVDSVPENELESTAFGKYDVIFLLGTERLGVQASENLASLEQWVSGGGGLVIMPSSQVDRAWFNEYIYRGGGGLAPLALQSIQGDESRSAWVQAQVDEIPHALIEPYKGPGNSLLADLKIFCWWSGSAISADAKDVSILARLTNVDRSPLVAEKPFGKGRVFGFTVPADAEWHNWPSQPSYVLLMQDLVRYLASGRHAPRSAQVGQLIDLTLDLKQYEPAAVLVAPGGQQIPLEATPSPSENTENATLWTLHHPAAAAQGIYEIQLKRRDDLRAARFLAVNVDPIEGDLRRVSTTQLARTLQPKNIQLTNAATAAELQPARVSGLWRYLIVGVVATLFAEQLLGWYLGRQRS